MILREIEKLAISLESIDIDGIDKQALIRTSCSKHYYFLFHAVSECFSIGFNDVYKASGGATHQAIRVCCELLSEKFNDKDFKKLGLKLKVLHDYRVSADYRITDTFTIQNLQLMKIEKDRALLLIDSLLKKYVDQDTMKQA